MYLFIPFLLILASAGGIVFIVWRKLPELKKLAEIESSNGIPASWHTLAYDLCPEIWNWAKGIKVGEYKEAWLIETEKLLRRLRVISLRMDRLSDSLIKKIRTQTYSGNDPTFAPVAKSEENQNERTKEDDKVELKKGEQKLIIEIAKNPKNSALYEELGDLYVKMGDYQDAKESYEAAEELNSNSEGLKKKLSQTLSKLHQQESSQG